MHRYLRWLFGNDGSVPPHIHERNQYQHIEQSWVVLRYRCRLELDAVYRRMEQPLLNLPRDHLIAHNADRHSYKRACRSSLLRMINTVAIRCGNRLLIVLNRPANDSDVFSMLNFP